MIKEIILLSTIYGFSSLYNQYIYPIFMIWIDYYHYNNIIISLLILLQINYFRLFNDLKKNDIEDKYMKIILNQIAYINQKEKEIEIKKNKYRNHRNHRSYSDIYN